jgi:glycine oxidase
MGQKDVLVIGGGIVGCSIAWRAAQKGFRVKIADAGRVGGEASWAGAGMLAPGGEVDDAASPWARWSVESLAMYPAFCEELKAESGRSIDFAVTGAREFGDLSALAKRADVQRTLGIPSCVELDHIAYPNDAVINARDVVAALREACLRRGVELLEDSPVGQLPETETSGWTVLAAGAWSSTLSPQSPAAFPVKGHLLGYWMEPGAIGPIYRRGHHYILQRQSGFAIAGSTTEHVGFDRSVDAAIVDQLHRETLAVIGSALPDQPAEAWIGFRPGVQGDPVVRREPGRRLWLAYGHYRNGILNAPVTARMVADGLEAD